MRPDVVPFHPSHLKRLKAQGAQAAQVSALADLDVATLVRPPGPALTVLASETVLLCGGIVTVDHRRGLLWAVLSEHAGQHMVFLHRGVARFIDSEPLRRLEATVEKGFEPGCRWIRLLGFVYEGDMAGYGDTGETHERYARVRL